MTILNALNIVGPFNSTITIDGNRQSRIFNIDNELATHIAVLFSGLRLSHGKADNGGPINDDVGGAIRNTENLNVAGCTFHGNVARSGGAIWSFANAVVTITDSTFTANSASNGGAIYNGGSITTKRSELIENDASDGGAIFVEEDGVFSVVDSNVADNSALFGGGIYSFGTVIVESSTIARNFADESGGGIDNRGSLNVINSTITANTIGQSQSSDGGGGISNDGDLTLSNSTVSGNVGTGNGGGILNGHVINGGTMTAVNCTIVGNRVNPGSNAPGYGGGVTSYSLPGVSAALINTIVAGNIASSGADLSGNFATTSFNNLIGDPDSAGGLINGINGNIVGRTQIFQQVLLPLASILDPVLRNNGGRTQTHALKATSVAVDAGDNHLATAFDQRGLPRIAGVDVDMGAFEMPRPTFADNFDRPDGPALGASWSIKTGKFAVAAAQALGATGKANLAVVNSLTAADLDLYVAAVLGLNQQAGLVARYSGAGDRNYYLAELKTDAAGIMDARLLRNVNGVVTELAVAENIINRGLRFRVIGSRLQLFSGADLIASAEDTTFRSGLAGIRTVGAAQFDNFEAYPALTGVDHLDLFTQFEGTTLSPHWTQPVGSYRASANTIRGEKTINIAVLNGVQSADVDVQARFTIPGKNHFAGLIARYQGKGDKSYYFGKLTRTDTGFVARIVKNIGGVNAAIASRTIVTPNAEASLRFLVTGSNLRLFVNGMLVGDVLNHSLTAGSVGIRSDQFATIDDFEATAVTAVLPFSDGLVSEVSTPLSDNWTRRVGGFHVGGGAIGTSRVNLAVLTGVERTDFIVEADVSLQEVNDEVGLVANYSGKGDANYYLARVRKTTAGVRLSIVRNLGGVMTTLKFVDVPAITGRIGFVVSRNQLTLIMNQVSQVNATDNTLTTGSVGIRTVGGGAVKNFSAMELAPLPFVDPLALPTLGAAWVTRAGKYTGGANARGSATLNFATVGRMNVDDVFLEADVDVTTLTGQFASLVARASGPGHRNMYQATIRRTDIGSVLQITKVMNGVATTLASTTVANSSGKLQFLVVGSELKLFLDGVEKLTAFDASLKSGSFGIRSSRDATFDDFSAGLPGN